MLLNTNDTAEILSYYTEEKIRLTAKLKHVESILRKLNGDNIDAQTGVLLTKKGSKAKKRGPKSVWGRYILDKLTEFDHPMSYRELMNLAMNEHNYDEARFQNVRASILNSAFRLRAIQGKVATVGQEGKKEKYLVLASWLNPDGTLLPKHHKWLRKEMDFTPDPVDLSEMPQPKYEEDLR